MVFLHDKSFVPYLTAEEIGERVAALGAQISADYAGLCPLFIGILNGSFIFAADLFRALEIDAAISFVKLSSYDGTSSTGHVVRAIGLKEDIAGRHVIIVEDIVDTGKTLHDFLPGLRQQGPASLKIATFLNKESARIAPVTPDYVGFEIPDRFVVGYGLDYDGLGRQLPGLWQLAG